MEQVPSTLKKTYDNSHMLNLLSALQYTYPTNFQQLTKFQKGSESAGCLLPASTHSTKGPNNIS